MLYAGRLVGKHSRLEFERYCCGRADAVVYTSYPAHGISHVTIIKLTENQVLRVIHAGVSDIDLEYKFGLVYAGNAISPSDYIDRGIREAYTVIDEKKASLFILKYCSE